MATTDDIFCKYCGGHDIEVEDSEWVDGDETCEFKTEIWKCMDCGKKMKVSTEWKMTNFCFKSEDGRWEDKEYDIVEL